MQHAKVYMQGVYAGMLTEEARDALGNAIEELALSLRGKKSKLNRDDLIDYYGRERLKLTSKAIDRVLSDLATALPRWFNLLDHSFLSPAMHTAYRDLLQARAHLLGL